MEHALRGLGAANKKALRALGKILDVHSSGVGVEERRVEAAVGVFYFTSGAFIRTAETNPLPIKLLMVLTNASEDASEQLALRSLSVMGQDCSNQRRKLSSSALTTLKFRGPFTTE